MKFSSSLYSGRIRHTRLRPFQHDFEYRVYYLLADVDELDRLDRDLRLFSVNRRNLFSLDVGLHGPGDGSWLRPWAERVLADADVEHDGGPIRLLAFPRILGYVFNPISVWYCHNRDGSLSAVIYEVRNTFGDRHIYVSHYTGRRSHSVAKAMHVSPFNDLDQSYRFSLTEPGARLTMSIEQSDDEGVMFRAGMRLSRLALSDRNLTRLFLTHPLLTLKVIGAIHWEALKIWIKGGTYHPRPPAPAQTVTIIAEEEVVQ